MSEHPAQGGCKNTSGEKILVGRAALPLLGHPHSLLGCNRSEDLPLPRPFLQPHVNVPCCVAAAEMQELLH